MIVRFVDIGGIHDHHYLNSLFIIWTKFKKFLLSENDTNEQHINVYFVGGPY